MKIFVINASCQIRLVLWKTGVMEKAFQSFNSENKYTDSNVPYI